MFNSTSKNTSHESGWIQLDNVTQGAIFQSSGIEKKEHGIQLQLYFRYVKKKLKKLEQMRVNTRVKKIEKAFDRAVENGQDLLASKVLREYTGAFRESLMYAKGFRLFIERDDLDRNKYRIRGGHISDTKFEDFTRIIPKDVLKKKKESDGLFDSYVIYHYWSNASEDSEAVKSMTPEEKEKMKDPILFGRINETNRLYFIADWEDEYCDLTFDEIVDKIGGDDDDFTIKRDPELLSNHS